MDRTRTIVAALAVALALVAGSPPRLVGDGGEYLAMAANFADLKGPSIASASLPSLQSRLAAFDPALADWNIDDSTIRSSRGGRDFLHFWFYPLLAAPFLLVMQGFHLPLTYAFAVVNLTLLGIALWIALPRLGSSASLLIFAGPIVWWIDKPHTEAFTFALLAIALLLFDERPWWSLVAAGAAATQNLPIAVFAAAIGAAAILTRPAWLRNPRFLIGAAAGSALAALHPIYTWTRHGTLSLLLRATKPGLPQFAEWRAVATDPQIGLLPNYPLLALVAAFAVLLLIVRRRTRDFAEPTMLLAAGGTAFFLYSFARTTNLHHGATPSLSRYGLWLVPLAIPLLRHAREAGGADWRRFVQVSAIVSSVVCVFAFHPRVPQYAYEPTPFANWLWTAHPAWNNPLPEVFSEVTLHAETQAVPAATANCEKVLLGGPQPAWPIPCLPAPVPAFCRAANQFCYANRDASDSYAFAIAPGRAAMFATRPDGVWPLEAEAAVRAVLIGWGGTALKVVPEGPAMLRAIEGARLTSLARGARTVFVVEATSDSPSLTLRPPAPMTGEIIDPVTGAVLTTLQFDGPHDEAWRVGLPAGHRLLLVRLDAMTKGQGS